MEFSNQVHGNEFYWLWWCLKVFLLDLLYFYIVFCACAACVTVSLDSFHAFFMPFQWYNCLSELWVLLNPLCPSLSCANISKQSFSTSGTTVGVYNMPFITVFFFNISFSIVKCFLSNFFSDHCFLSRPTSGSCSWSSFILELVNGSSISMSF